MKRLCAFVFAAAVSASVLAAPPSDASIEKLLKVTESEKITDQVLQSLDGMMQAGIKQSLQNQQVSEEGRKAIDRFRTRMVAVIKDEFSWAKLKPMYVTIYKEEFTQNEIDGLLEFYASPTGKAFIAKMPAVMQRSMVMTQQRMAPIMQRMQIEMQQTMAEVKAVEQKKTDAPKK